MLEFGLSTLPSRTLATRAAGGSASGRGRRGGSGSRDNTTATVRAKEHKTTINNRHVALKYHFIRDAFLKRRIVTDFVGTADNHSDLGTKATSPGTFKKLVMRMKGYEPFWIPEHSRDHIMNTPSTGILT